MSEALATTSPGEASLAAFAESLATARAGTPALLLFTGNGGGPRSELSLLAQDAPAGRGTRVVEVEPGIAGRYDPVAAACRNWQQGVVRVSFESTGSRLALEWLQVLPVWGDLLAAIAETWRALRERKHEGQRDVEAARLLHAARRRPIVLVLHDLHLADHAAAHRLAALIAHAGARSRLLIVGGVELSAQGTAQPAILDVAGFLPAERVHVERLATQGGAVLDSLAGSSRDALNAVHAAAVLGDSFNGASVARMLEIDELSAEDRLALAVRSGLIHVAGVIDLPDGDIVTEYRFEAGGVRVATLAAIPADVLTRLRHRAQQARPVR